jgi:hypothetical protein
MYPPLDYRYHVKSDLSSAEKNSRVVTIELIPLKPLVLSFDGKVCSRTDRPIARIREGKMSKLWLLVLLAGVAPQTVAQAPPNNAVQYNNSGAFGGINTFTFYPLSQPTFTPTPPSDPGLYSQGIEGYYFADQNAGGITATGIFSSTLCTVAGCFVIAPPSWPWSASTSFSSYAVNANAPYHGFVGTPRSILKDDRGAASAVLFRDPVQQTEGNAHFAYMHSCLFSTPYEPTNASADGGGSCFQMSMAGANSGFSHGNPGFLSGLSGQGWSSGGAFGIHYTNFTPGIHQGMSMSYYNQAVGDTAGAYYYVQTNGGVTAPSDEGFKGLAGDSGENPYQYYTTGPLMLREGWASRT